MKGLVLVREAAEELGVTEHALRLRIWRGQFPCVRWGKRVFVTREQLDGFIKGLPGQGVNEALARADKD